MLGINGGLGIDPIEMSVRYGNSFKVSVGSVVLMQYLDMEIPFKVSMGSVMVL